MDTYWRWCGSLNDFIDANLQVTASRRSFLNLNYTAEFSAAPPLPPGVYIALLPFTPTIRKTTFPMSTRRRRRRAALCRHSAPFILTSARALLPFLWAACGGKMAVQISKKRKVRFLAWAWELWRCAGPGLLEVPLWDRRPRALPRKAASASWRCCGPRMAVDWMRGRRLAAQCGQKRGRQILPVLDGDGHRRRSLWAILALQN
jgi:hypothetical protein